MQVEHVERPIDDCTVTISPQVATIVHSNYWQVALASIYVYISLRCMSMSQVSGTLHVAQFLIHFLDVL